jgi:hypothetical protein
LTERLVFFFALFAESRKVERVHQKVITNNTTKQTTTRTDLSWKERNIPPMLSPRAATSPDEVSDSDEEEEDEAENWKFLVVKFSKEEIDGEGKRMVCWSGRSRVRGAVE